MYGSSGEPKEVGQLIYAWKHRHRMRLDNILDKVSSEYAVWRAQKIEDKVMLPARMRVPVTDPPPRKLSELEIARAEFKVERLKMEQENKRLREKSKKWEDQAQKQEYKIQRIEENYAKMKGENQNLYEANKKLWTQIKDSKIGQFFDTNRRESESSQRQSNRWQQ